jgi:hypothetical protein
MTTDAMTSIAPERASAARPGAAAPPDASLPIKAFTNVLVVSAMVTIVVTFVMLFVLDGWTYYRTPRTVRGYLPAHQWLRPSGTVGQWMGIAGLLLMFVPMLYAIRKHSARLARFGSMKAWLELHIFCGIIGPVLVTYHTSFKFNGIVSVAYWMMVVVASSGFVGRYLYVRIPRSLRGTELTLSEVQRRAEVLKAQLAVSGIPEPVLARVAALETRLTPSTRPGAWLVSLTVGDLALHYRLWALGRALRAHGGSAEHDTDIRNLIAERALLLRRLALLERTRRLFDLWHVFHQPLVAFLFLIVLIHVALVTYMGYTVFSGWLL